MKGNVMGETKPVYECPHGCGRTFERPQGQAIHAATCVKNPNPRPRKKYGARKPKLLSQDGGKGHSRGRLCHTSGSPVAMMRGMFEQAIRVLSDHEELVTECVTGYEGFLEQGRKLAVAYAKSRKQIARLRSKAKVLAFADAPAETDE